MARIRTLLISFANPAFSMGINSIGSAMERQGYHVWNVYFVPRIQRMQRFATFGDNDYRTLLDLIRQIRPDVIGLSVYSNFLREAIDLTGRLRAETTAMIIWGGIHPTVEPLESIEYADAICRGEGEEALCELIRRLEEGRSYADIDNLWVRQNGKVVKNRSVLIDNLDRLPFATYAKPNAYLLGEAGMQPIARPYSFHSIMTSRGCYFACAYCSMSSLRNVYQKYRVRRRSVDNVIGELVAAVRDNPHLERMYFYDDVFTFDLDWMSEFKTRYRNEIGIPFFCYTHPSLVSDDMMRCIREAGCCLISMGIQGPSRRIRDLYNRKTSRDEIKRACTVINKYRFSEFYIDMILSPFDTPEDRHEGLELLLDLPKPFHVVMHKLTFFPRAGITERAIRDGIIAEDQIVSRLQTPSHQLGISPSELKSEWGKWWMLYSVCGRKMIPRWLIGLLKDVSVGVAFVYFIHRIIEKLQLLLNRRNVFTR